MRETDKEKEKILQSFKRLKGNYFRRNLGYEMQEDPAFSQPSLSLLPAFFQPSQPNGFLMARSIPSCRQGLWADFRACSPSCAESWLHRRTWRSSQGSPVLAQDQHEDLEPVPPKNNQRTFPQVEETAQCGIRTPQPRRSQLQTLPG